MPEQGTGNSITGIKSTGGYMLPKIRYFACVLTILKFYFRMGHGWSCKRIYAKIWLWWQVVEDNSHKATGAQMELGLWVHKHLILYVCVWSRGAGGWKCQNSNQNHALKVFICYLVHWELKLYWSEQSKNMLLGNQVLIEWIKHNLCLQGMQKKRHPPRLFWSLEFNWENRNKNVILRKGQNYTVVQKWVT